LGVQALNIGIDIDGVLASFDQAYGQKIIEVTGKDLFPYKPYEPPCWNWTEPLGYTKEEDKAAWDAVVKDPDFWFNLKPYPTTTAILTALWRRRAKGDAVYFITTRMGIAPKTQTEEWLMAQQEHRLTSFPFPTVLISANKGPVAAGLDLDWYADDKPENVVAVGEAVPHCRTILVDRPWNQHSKWGLRLSVDQLAADLREAAVSR
jgi:5'(3')-deoxyribonucleotidase